MTTSCQRPPRRSLWTNPLNPELTRADRIAILEELARDENVNPRERIQAIRLLEEMRQGEQPPGTFEDLDEVGRRRVRARKPA